jgi:hypothetical protein
MLKIVIKAEIAKSRIYLLEMAAKYEGLGSSIVPFTHLGKRNGAVTVAPNGIKFVVYLTKTSIVYEELVTPSTKQCPFCGTDRLALFSSRNRKMCTICHIDIVWELGKGQKPLIEAQR